MCFVLGSAALATAGLARLSAALMLCPLLTVLVAVTLWWWHEPRDWPGWSSARSSGTLQNCRAACRALDKPHTAVFGVAPAYIFLCYPLLGLAFPRLVDAAGWSRRPAAEGSGNDAGPGCMLGRRSSAWLA